MKCILGERTFVVLRFVERLRLERSKRGSSGSDEITRHQSQGKGVYQEPKRWNETQIVSRDSSYWEIKGMLDYAINFWGKLTQTF